MSAATTDRNPDKNFDNLVLALPVLADAVIPSGVLVAVNASGYATNGADTAGLRVIGCSTQSVDATGEASGDSTIEVDRRPYLMENSSGNALTIAHVGQLCYVEDNQTVGSDPGDNAIVAGVVHDVTSEGVYVDFAGIADAVSSPEIGISSTDNEDGTATVTVQCSKAGRQVLQLWLSTAAYGAAADPGDIAATTGSILVEDTADALLQAVTDANGTLVLTLTRTADGSTYVNAEKNGNAVSAEVAVTGN